jgi:hypothetical protein
MRAKEFIQENKKPFRKSQSQSLPNLTSSKDLDNNNHPYLAYRFGVALAPSPDTENTYSEGPIGSDFSMIDYSDGDREIRQAAAKKMGIKFNRGTGKGSEELSGSIINKVSPVATPKKNKYGV